MPESLTWLNATPGDLFLTKKKVGKLETCNNVSCQVLYVFWQFLDIAERGWIGAEEKAVKKYLRQRKILRNNHGLKALFGLLGYHLWPFVYLSANTKFALCNFYLFFPVCGHLITSELATTQWLMSYEALRLKDRTVNMLNTNGCIFWLRKIMMNYYTLGQRFPNLLWSLCPSSIVPCHGSTPPKISHE